ncbi:MAG: Gfo/Idh/MocA family oxidoreductase [Elusimicrobia bacterium]|nr:Gfo/Idh/MocA family oxidoreductase [Elusimicrobiota bacterium]
MSASPDGKSRSQGGRSAIGVGVIGYGYWGPNLARNFAESPDCELIAVADLKPDLAALARRRHPASRVTSDPKELINNPKVEAVIIATPVSTHHALALQALKAGKHVLVTKPLASSSEQCLELIGEAARRKLVLMVDHTFVYTGAVRKIHELVAKGDLGDIYYYDSVRVNLGLFQHDVNVIWDLAVHDLSIMDFVLPKRPVAVSATGIAHVPRGLENTAYLTLFFDDSVIGHVHANWLSPVKMRRTLIAGSKKMIVYDDLEPSEKIKVYDKGITLNGDAESVYKMLVGYRAGDMWAPQIDITEALRVEAKHFAACVSGKEKPLTPGEAGLRTIALLEAATRSMHNRGQPVELPALHAGR